MLRQMVEQAHGGKGRCLVGEHRPELGLVEHGHDAGLEEDGGPVGAEGEGVGERSLDDVKRRHRSDVERRVGGPMGAPDLRQLAISEPHAVAQQQLHHPALNGQLEQLLDHGVEEGQPMQECGGRSVGRMLVRLGADAGVWRQRGCGGGRLRGHRLTRPP